MEFKLWLNEIVDIQRPSSKLNKSTVIKNKGTNTARPVIQYRWKTKLGNDVKIHFEKDGENSYDVIFYVNDTQFDDETSDGDRVRDPEVLSGVFYVLRNKAEQLGIKRLTFEAQKSPKDFKIIYNLPIQPHKDNTLKILFNILKFLENRVPIMISPTQNQIDIAKKFNKPKPIIRPDIGPEVQEKLKTIIEKVKKEELVDYYDFARDVGRIEQYNLENILDDLEKVLSYLDRYNQIIKSRTTEGWNRHKNRRAEVYEKLLNRYFSDWNIERHGQYFILQRI